MGGGSDVSQAKSIAQNNVDSNYFALHRIPVIVQGREVGKTFAEAKDNLVAIAGENKKGA